jgi:hypothetical protein
MTPANIPTPAEQVGATSFEQPMSWAEAAAYLKVRYAIGSGRQSVLAKLAHHGRGPAFVRWDLRRTISDRAALDSWAVSELGEPSAQAAPRAPKPAARSEVGAA